MTDQELLRDFAEHRSESAFSELVRRHLDLVYSAAVRLTVDSHLAEDVTQGVFVALAKQSREVARKLANGAPLSGWLHVTTRHLAAKAVRSEVRRRNRELEAAMMHELSSTEAAVAWKQMAPHLDHALAELPEPDRDALLLRFFERKTAREIGQRLGLSEEAAQKRVSRALERLRDRFSARGVTVSTSAFVAMLSVQAVQAAPVSLACGIVKSALAASALAAAPIGLAVSPTQLVSTLVMSKTQTAVLLGIAAAFAIPIGLQQANLHQPRAGPVAAQQPLVRTNVTPASPLPLAKETEADEIERLRRQADDLRAKLAAKRSRAAAPLEIPKLAAGPTLLAIGNTVRMNQLTFAGNATPEAALQSMLAFQRDGDVDGAASLMLFSPTVADEWNKMLSSHDLRAKLAQNMIESTQGAVRDGVPIQQFEETKYPANPQAAATVEILEKQKIDERRIQFSLKILRGSESETRTPIFGLTSSGWKELP